MERRAEMKLDHLRLNGERAWTADVDRRPRKEHERWIRMRGERSTILMRSRKARRRLSTKSSTDKVRNPLNQFKNPLVFPLR